MLLGRGDVVKGPFFVDERRSGWEAELIDCVGTPSNPRCVARAFVEELISM